MNFKLILKSLAALCLFTLSNMNAFPYKFTRLVYTPSKNDCFIKRKVTIDLISDIHEQGPILKHLPTEELTLLSKNTLLNVLKSQNPAKTHFLFEIESGEISPSTRITMQQIGSEIRNFYRSSNNFTSMDFNRMSYIISIDKYSLIDLVSSITKAGLSISENLNRFIATHPDHAILNTIREYEPLLNMKISEIFFMFNSIINPIDGKFEDIILNTINEKTKENKEILSIFKDTYLLGHQDETLREFLFKKNMPELLHFLVDLYKLRTFFTEKYFDGTILQNLLTTLILDKNKNHIIIYAGGYHCNSVKQILTQAGLKTTISLGNSSETFINQDGTLNIPTIIDPLAWNHIYTKPANKLTRIFNWTLNKLHMNCCKKKTS